MDAVQDLAARAAAYMIVIQQLCVDHPEGLIQTDSEFSIKKENTAVLELLRNKGPENDKFKERAFELLWINNKKAAMNEIAKILSERLAALLKLVWEWEKSPNQMYSKYERADLWTEEDFDFNEEQSNKLHQEELAPLLSPDQWRTYFCDILYNHQLQRLQLANKIKYMPLQVILEVDTTLKRADIQILQQWNAADHDLKILADPLSKIHRRLSGFDRKKAEMYLENQLLFTEGNMQNNALPFELIFNQEQEEISKNRKMRLKEHQLLRLNESNIDTPIVSSEEKTRDRDPLSESKNMRLTALAFSGGGIRSATFNLGVLQALSRTEYLSKFDYLSTVSGGGYIGSWLVAWIKREGSLIKVCSRLNRDKSGDPMAEEVRPIRWLRMFSNYLTPTTGIMSVDSWTVGMTIIRNMLLNQLIIFLMFITVLLFGKVMFTYWVEELINVSDQLVLIITSVLIISAAILAGEGMRSYHRKPLPKNEKLFLGHLKQHLSLYLLLMGYFSAILVSAWLCNEAFPVKFTSSGVVDDYQAALCTFFYPGIVCFLALLLVAVLDRYDICVPGYEDDKPWNHPSRLLRLLLIFVSSLVATVIGAIVLVVSWRIIASLGESCSRYAKSQGFDAYPKALVFVLGPPLILEVLSVAIVMRMALLGNYFPDERREWWGRIGGHVHRVAFIWILVVGSALVGATIVYDSIPPNAGNDILKAAGGWAVIIGVTVKAAFSPKSGTEQPGVMSATFGFIAKAGPYLFVLGLLLFLPVLLDSVLNDYFNGFNQNIWFFVGATVALASVTAILAWRIGVNEFSMHHFYKNRLVRAFLGGTRSRSDRKRTSNSFTGFDDEDDLRLADLINEKHYHGPYPVINAALNASKVADLDRQDRKAESFTFSPLYCGFDFSPTRASCGEAENSFDYGYRPTASYAYPKGPPLGSAMSISGAAANPNQGFHSSAATAFLLTAFNVRLGWWIGNPRGSCWTKADPDFGLPYLLSNLVGKSNTSDLFVSLSDGGHFDNTGLYEMIRRRVSFIVLGDAEQDDTFSCEALANTIRRCWIDFGVEIDIDVSEITNRNNNFSKKSFAIGRIVYPGKKPWLGVLIYLKSSVTDDQAVDIREYAMKNKTFPHQSTGDQFFNEAQFESYRKLGFNIASKAFEDPIIKAMFAKL